MSMRMTVSAYAVGGWLEPQERYAAPQITPLYACVFPREPAPSELSDVEADVGAVNAAGVSSVDALRILAAVGWRRDVAVAVVHSAKADGADPVALAREIGDRP
jgi:hypothetical protein